MDRGLAVVFAGTPDFALPSLDAIAASRHRIVAVYTQPDRPSGRGRALAASPVKQRALALGLPIRAAGTLQDHDAAADARGACAGRHGRRRLRAAAAARDPRDAEARLPEHPRLAAAALARRGAGRARDPGGRRATGVCIMQMEAGLDTGPVMLRREIAIGARETAGELESRLAARGRRRDRRGARCARRGAARRSSRRTKRARPTPRS